MASESKGWAFIGTLPIIGFIIVLLANKRDKYAMFYGKQGLALGIVQVVLSIVLTILIVTIPLLPILHLVILILWIISVVNAFSGKQKATPLVGKLAARF